MKKILFGNVVLPDKVIKNGQLVIENGLISYTGKPRKEKYDDVSEIFEAKKGYIWPGLIDIHVHGSGGYDVMDGTGKSFSGMAKSLLQSGVTGFLATTITSSRGQLTDVLAKIAKWESSIGESELIGVHIEGPWISRAFKGAHYQGYIRPPKASDAKWLYDLIKDKLKIVTLAPELPNAHELINELIDLDVIVSIGHTDASYSEMQCAVSLGASHITHTFNALRGFTHKEPGVVGAALTMEELCCEVIADGIHVHPAAVKMLIEAKGTDKVILISDGMRAVNMPDGEYKLGELNVYVGNGKAILKNGKLAGSLLTLNKAVVNVMEYAGLPVYEAVKMASLNPARRLGLEKETGSIEVGKRANIIAVDENGEVEKVWMDGEEQSFN